MSWGVEPPPKCPAAASSRPGCLSWAGRRGPAPWGASACAWNRHLLYSFFSV